MERLLLEFRMTFISAPPLISEGGIRISLKPLSLLATLLRLVSLLELFSLVGTTWRLVPKISS
ncbi:MAG: hypothetical protein RIR40_1016 [Actinomycetota bacterium]